MRVVSRGRTGLCVRWDFTCHYSLLCYSYQAGLSAGFARLPHLSVPTVINGTGALLQHRYFTPLTESTCTSRRHILRDPRAALCYLHAFLTVRRGDDEPSSPEASILRPVPLSATSQHKSLSLHAPPLRPQGFLFCLFRPPALPKMQPRAFFLV